MQSINRFVAEQIKTGMNEQEVEALLGPAGNYATHPVEWDQESPFEVALRSWWHCKEWISDDGVILVRFGDSTGKVLSVDFREVHLPAPKFLDRLRGWLHWPAAKK